MQGLDAPAFGHELRCQPVEQLRVAGLLAQGAEIAHAGHDAFAEMMRPNAVHHHAGQERMLAIGEAVGKGQATSGGGNGRSFLSKLHLALTGQNGEFAGLHLLLGLLGIATIEDEGGGDRGGRFRLLFEGMHKLFHRLLGADGSGFVRHGLQLRSVLGVIGGVVKIEGTRAEFFHAGIVLQQLQLRWCALSGDSFEGFAQVIADLLITLGHFLFQDLIDEHLSLCQTGRIDLFGFDFYLGTHFLLGISKQ